MTSLKGVDEPMLMRLRRHATVVVKTTEMRNRNPSIIELVNYVYAVNRLGTCQTFRKYFQPGRPRSRAKTQVILDEAGTNPIITHICKAVIIATMAVLPDTEPVAWIKISMKGYPVGDFVAASRSPTQKKTATNIPKPKKPFSIILVINERGTTVEAFRISLDIRDNF